MFYHVCPCLPANTPGNHMCQQRPRGKYTKDYTNVINICTTIGIGNFWDNAQRDRTGIRNKPEAYGIFCILSK